MVVTIDDRVRQLNNLLKDRYGLTVKEIISTAIYDYIVALDEWVPQSTTYIISNKQFGSLIGIPKISDGALTSYRPQASKVYFIINNIF
ncbi:MAG: hypothetical protein WAM14_25940 [Candidatus Nitrosopolaris sp.]